MASVFSPQLKRLLGYTKPYSVRLAVGIVLVAFVAVAEGIVAFMARLAFDYVLTPSAASSDLPLFTLPNGHILYLNHLFPARFHNVWTIFSIALLILFVCKGVAEYLGVIQIQYAGHKAITDLRNQVYAKIIHQPMAFFQSHPTGRIVSGVVNDVEKTRIALSDYLADLFLKSFTLVVFLSVMLYFDWKATLACGVVLPLVVLPVGKFGKKIRRSSERSQERLGELSQILQETVSGNRVVKAFGMEEFELRKFREAARRLLKESMRWVRAGVATTPIMDLLGAVIIPLLLLYARQQIKLHTMTPGMFMGFLYAMFNAYMPLKRVGQVYQQFQFAQGASGQVFAYLDMPEEQIEAPGAQKLPPFSREIVYDEVTFAYDAVSTPVLQNVALRANKGEVIALVGSSGAGKTTLVNLLPRFHDVTSGAIRVDGVDTREVTLRSLREQIAVVTQETILFHDTVRNNICYGLSNIPRERVEEAARAALAHDFIQELPQGYDTLIGERGTRLSGGQRQRIAIARAILKDSPILILDEATSELDSESELFVQRALSNLMVGRTTFVIAHRLGTIRKADKILVLEDGQIRESGTHADLMAKGGSYARLHELQFAEEEMLAPAEGEGSHPADAGRKT
ncbi:MAG TPA: ABC transporter ATP-binding protein [Candidatus Acidoferrum sp.]